MTRLTFICPAAHRDDANDLACVLAFSAADSNTYREPAWQDAQGNLYSVASSPVGDDFVGSATSALERPEWDAEPYTVNMAGARRAQALVTLWDGEGDVPQATPDTLLVLPGDNPLALLAAAGLTPIPIEI